jgi:GNAT superfamily N-acetyltransferase
MQFTIRPATADDDAAMTKMFLAINRYEAPITHDRRTDYAGAVESLVAARERVEKNAGRILVAESGGLVVGHLYLLFLNYDVYVVEALRRYAYVSELFVRENVRGAGIATALLAAAERIAAESGVARIAIGVLAGNAPADRLYAKLGFQPHYIERSKPVSHTPG